MSLDIARHARTDASARRLIERQCWPCGRPVCPRCAAQKVYALAEGRVRCAVCRYTFHSLSGRFAGLAGLTPRQWLRLLELFAAKETSHAMAAALSVAYNTAYKAATIVRLAILAGSFDGLAILRGRLGRELGFSGKTLRPVPADAPLADVPVFGILERGDMVFVDYLPDMTPEDMLHFNLHFSLPLSRLGAIVYSDRYQSYQTLVTCGSEVLSRRFVEVAGRIPAVEPRQEGFWAYARERLVRFHGVTARKFPLYLKELEFRHNQRGSDILPILLANICAFVPDLN
ncbi:MAG: IS1595 family transposase [Solidesulfovibrio sp.]|uniref:IS1595 family transposase n=1 Tax=Solidesulfovibrio sp. TaxID=2910990 RepID=UPI0031597545